MEMLVIMRTGRAIPTPSDQMLKQSFEMNLIVESSQVGGLYGVATRYGALTLNLTA